MITRYIFERYDRAGLIFLIASALLAVLVPAGNLLAPPDSPFHVPDHVVSLATSGILVNVEVSVWTGTKQDREISDEVTQAKKADRDAGRL